MTEEIARWIFPPAPLDGAIKPVRPLRVVVASQLVGPALHLSRAANVRCPEGPVAAHAKACRVFSSTTIAEPQKLTGENRELGIATLPVVP